MYAVVRRLRASWAVQPIDRTLVADLGSLDAEVEHHDSDDQHQDRVGSEVEQQPAHERQDERGAGGRRAVAAVGESSGDLSCAGAGDSGEA